MITAVGASLHYEDHGREVHACEAIDVEVRDGEFLGILGPSGSGKSSLLYLLSGLKQPTAGDIRYRGRVMASMSDDERARLRLERFGFIFQHPFLLGYLTAVENVVLARPNEDRVAEAEDLLERLGLGSKTHRLPHELSGGERQRVCVARALLGSPEVIFADEPTAALDHANGVQVVELLDRHRGRGSLVMVTHDPTMLEGADRIVTLADGHLIDSCG
ncbi:MAG TPA: ATP-binding cassette domain-containing protein [Fimbriimonadaceae bacterium]|nr:ATP-binding cassette domain-containing protein [Fimbriimonadaceae bacterium]